MTVNEIRNTKRGEKITCTGLMVGAGVFTVGNKYIVYDSPVGKTVKNDNGVNKFIFDIMDMFSI